MIKSMTGFGRGEFSDGKREVSVELKSVNHRYCEIYARIPRRYSFAEEMVKNTIKERVKRGKIDITVNIDDLTESDFAVKLNMAAARQYFKNLRDIQKNFDVTGDISLDLLSSMPEVMKSVPDVENEEEVMNSISKALDQALDDFDAMRQREGEKLKKDIIKRDDAIAANLAEISKHAPELQKIYADKLKDRIADILEDKSQVTDERIAAEAAYFADKVNITEEIVRLKSHIEQLKSILDDDDRTKGKKLDFLIQEFNREINTIASKANDLGITQLMLEMKSETEKIREQIQNIE